MKTLYIQVGLSADSTAGLPKLVGFVGFVHGRAEASEVGKDDALLLQEKAKKQRADLDWQIDRTYSGKYVVRGQSRA